MNSATVIFHPRWIVKNLVHVSRDYCCYYIITKDLKAASSSGCVGDVHPNIQSCKFIHFLVNLIKFPAYIPHCCVLPHGTPSARGRCFFNR